MLSLSRRTLLAALLLSSAAWLFQASAQSAPDLVEAAKQAYIYTYPLVLTEATARLLTAQEKPQPNGYAPMNQLGKKKGTVKAGFTDVVSPNSEVVFSSGFLSEGGTRQVTPSRRRIS